MCQTQLRAQSSSAVVIYFCVYIHVQDIHCDVNRLSILQFMCRYIHVHCMCQPTGGPTVLKTSERVSLGVMLCPAHVLEHPWLLNKQLKLSVYLPMRIHFSLLGFLLGFRLAGEDISDILSNREAALRCAIILHLLSSTPGMKPDLAERDFDTLISPRDSESSGIGSSVRFCTSGSSSMQRRASLAFLSRSPLSFRFSYKYTTKWYYGWCRLYLELSFINACEDNYCTTPQLVDIS